MSKCLNCDKFNDLADENELILLKYNNLKEEYNFLKVRYDRYDQICYDFFLCGSTIGVILTLIILTILIK